jgi:hypothetical protein
MVSHHGIEANPTKVDAMCKMKRPIGKKDVMKLTNIIPALGRFINKLGEKGLPFFKLLKKSNKFEWTDEADQALEELKAFLTMPPIMVPPAPKETFLDGIADPTGDFPKRIGISGRRRPAASVVWTSLGPLPRWVPGPTTRWAPGTTRLALHGT